MPKEKSAGVIIFRKEDNQIYYLLLYYKTESKRGGHWGFSKGHIEKGETEIQTAKRELAEETGIKDIKIISGFNGLEKYFFRRNYGLKGEARKKAPWVFKSVVFYLAETETKEVKISEEHSDFIWLSYQEAFKKLTFKNAKNILKKANDFVIQGALKHKE
ncbi:MAG: NUDIX domain-containing protein [Patescibacteria group bacterium]